MRWIDQVDRDPRRNGDRLRRLVDQRIDRPVVVERNRHKVSDLPGAVVAAVVDEGATVDQKCTGAAPARMPELLMKVPLLLMVPEAAPPARTKVVVLLSEPRPLLVKLPLLPRKMVPEAFGRAAIEAIVAVRGGRSDANVSDGIGPHRSE